MKPSDVSRRAFLASAAAAAVGCATDLHSRPAGRRPNIVLIITDDQGYGDLGCHGNAQVRTPHLDALHGESVRMTRFYVSPVCAPTRASLMTGRYNYRTCAIDTYRGRAMMHPDEVTIAERLRENGYRTGIFGKWHLGDCYPMRPMDNGFEASLVHHGGGIGQPSDPPGSGYFDPVLLSNGIEEKRNGYCTEVFADAAIGFIRNHADKPFFTYFATNAPHSPLIAPEADIRPYIEMGLSETIAKTYAMITNLDRNVGRILSTLDELNIADDTIVIFMTDNGAAQRDTARFNAGLRGQKGTVYEGGIRVPCFIRWPNALEGGRDIGRLAAHIDFHPTLLAACGLGSAGAPRVDGRNLLPLLRDGATEWPDRRVVLQWHRGDAPEAFKNAAVVTQRWKLVEGRELYDLANDPAEANDMASREPGKVAELRQAYQEWFADVSATRGFDPPRIVLGADAAPKVTLSQQDWRGIQTNSEDDIGFWLTHVERPGRYEIRLRFKDAADSEQEARVQLGPRTLGGALAKGVREAKFSDVPLDEGPLTIAGWSQSEKTQRAVLFIDIVSQGSLGEPASGGA